MEQPNNCQNCVHIGYIDEQHNVGRCTKWREVVNLLALELCYKSEKSKPIEQNKQVKQLELFLNE